MQIDFVLYKNYFPPLMHRRMCWMTYFEQGNGKEKPCISAVHIQLLGYVSVWFDRTVGTQSLADYNHQHFTSFLTWHL